MCWTDSKKIKFSESTDNEQYFEVKMVALSPWKQWPFKLEVHKKYLFGFNHSHLVVKTEFLKKSGCTLILATCYSSIQSYFKIDLILTMLFHFYFLF